MTPLREGEGEIREYLARGRVIRIEEAIDENNALGGTR
jgi:hypothetical protein